MGYAYQFSNIAVVFEANDGMVDGLLKDLEGCRIFGQAEGVV
jgi:hypothetical protein